MMGANFMKDKILYLVTGVMTQKMSQLIYIVHYVGSFNSNLDEPKTIIRPSNRKMSCSFNIV